MCRMKKLFLLVVMCCFLPHFHLSSELVNHVCCCLFLFLSVSVKKYTTFFSTDKEKNGHICEGGYVVWIFVYVDQLHCAITIWVL